MERTHSEFLIPPGFEVSREFQFVSGEPMLVLPGVKFEERFAGSMRETEEALDKYGLAIVVSPSGVGKSELFVGKGYGDNFVHGGLPDLFARRGWSWMPKTLQGLSFKRLPSDTPEDLERIREELTGQEEIVFEEGENGEKKRKWVLPGNLDVWVFDESVKIGEGIGFVKMLRDEWQKGRKMVFVGGGVSGSEEQSQRIIEALLAGGFGEEIKSAVVKLQPHLCTTEQAKELLTRAFVPEDMAGEVVERIMSKGLPLMPRVVWMAGLPYSRNRPPEREAFLKWVDEKMGRDGRTFWSSYLMQVARIGV